MKQQLLEAKLREIQKLAEEGLVNTSSAPSKLVDILRVIMEK